MAHTIQIKCNGPNQHVNEVDLDKALRPTPVVRGGPPPVRPERVVIPCRSCTEGKIVLSRTMIDEILGES